MKKLTGIYLDFANTDAISWFVANASRIKIGRNDDIVETSTGKIIGNLITIKGFHAQKFIKEFNTLFMKDAVQ